MHDRHEIVGAEPPLDELLRGAFHARRPAEVRVVIVDHHHVDAAVERTLVRLHIGLDRIGLEQRAIRALDRNVDERKRADRLRLPVLEDLKVLLFQIADEVTLTIGDDDVHFHVIDADAERGPLGLRRRRLRLAGRGRVLSGRRRRAGEDDEQQRESGTSCHRTLTNALA